MIINIYIYICVCTDMYIHILTQIRIDLPLDGLVKSIELRSKISPCLKKGTTSKNEASRVGKESVKTRLKKRKKKTGTTWD